MIFSALSLEGAYIIEPEVFNDDRGMFYRYSCKNELAQIGHQKEWVQLNHSYTYKSGSLRGMHYQLPPYTEIKMVKCIAGKVFDVIVDVRQESSTFLQWCGVELSSENRKMIYIPEGFAHGFQCLSDNCELIYHHSAFYTPGHEGGLRFDDPAIGITWPLPVTSISERDKSHSFITASFNGIKLT